MTSSSRPLKISLPACLWLAVLLSLYGCLLFMNFRIPLMEEDYALTGLTVHSSSSPAHFLALLGRMLKGETFHWTLRLGDQFTYIFLALPEILYNSFMPAVVLSYVALAFYYGTARFPSPASLSDLLVYCSLVTVFALFSVNLGDTVFWRTGFLNYLFPLSLLLLAALPYRRYLHAEAGGIQKPVLIALYMVACFLVSFGNENTTPVVIALGFALIARDIWKKRRPPLWLSLSFMSFFAGWCLFILAPITRARIRFYRDAAGLLPNISPAEVWHNLQTVMNAFAQTAWPLLLIAGACAAVLLYGKMKKRPSSPPRLFYETVFILFLSSLSIMALFFSPYLETRAFILSHFCMAATIASAFFLALLQYRENPIYGKAISVFGATLLLAMAVCGACIFKECLAYYAFATERATAILRAVSSGSKSMAIPRWRKKEHFIKHREDYIFAQAVSGGAHHFARYFGIEEPVGTANGERLISDRDILFDTMSQIPGADAAYYIETSTYGGQQSYSSLRGWAIDAKDKDAPEAIFIEVNDRFFPAFFFNRPDLVTHFQTEKVLSSGFTCHIPPYAFPQGGHTVRLHIISKSLSHIYSIPLDIFQ